MEWGWNPPIPYGIYWGVLRPQRFGCLPFFMVTGAHPILPLNVQEATWLVELLDCVWATEELIGY